MFRRFAILSCGLVLGLVAPAPLVLVGQGSEASAKSSRHKVKTVKSRHQASPLEKSAAARAPAGAAVVAAVAPPLSAPSAVSASVSNPWPLTLTLSTDRPSYKPGELMTIAAVADAACDLTLISIDRDGFAVVLFPNEYEPDNLMSPGVPKTIPRVDAAYQLRAKQPGTEALLGICSPPGTRPRGISADYERFRFTLIGDWSEFTASVPQREVEIVKAAEEARRKHRRREPALMPLLPASDASSQGRSLLLVDIDEGPRAP